MHPKNLHKDRYNLDHLVEIYPILSKFVFVNKYNIQTLDFSNSEAVQALNTALLKKYYNIAYWDFPDDNLCPPIPSRVDYIHHLNDLISDDNNPITVLDIGVGATCIYPLLGNTVYNWQFVGTDINKDSLQNAKKIISKNHKNSQIQLRLQSDKNSILNGVITKDDKFTCSMCNPPFFKSKQDALKANTRKVKNLNISQGRNFSGNSDELWYKGGEKAFLHNYIYESTQYKDQFEWFTSLVSKKELIQGLKTSLIKLKANNIKVIEMHQGHKISRIIAWQF